MALKRTIDFWCASAGDHVPHRSIADLWNPRGAGPIASQRSAPYDRIVVRRALCWRQLLFFWQNPPCP